VSKRNHLETGKSVWEKVEEIIHYSYIVYILITLGAIWFSYDEASSAKEIILSVSVTIVLALLLIYVLLTTYRFGRKSRYAESQPSMHTCQHTLRDCYHYLTRCLSDEPEHKDIKFEESEFQAQLCTALTALNTAFNISTSVNCRTSIKLLGAINNDLSRSENLYLKTLARDSVSADMKKHDDKGEGTKHLLNSNSDFQMLHAGDIDYFFNGALWKDTSYRNSSDESPQNGTQKRKDYNSVIVWPIRYKLQPDERQGTKNSINQILLGFLTADAIASNAFEERFDVNMGAQVADTLYVVLQRYREVKAKLEQEEANRANLEAKMEELQAGLKDEEAHP